MRRVAVLALPALAAPAPAQITQMAFAVYGVDGAFLAGPLATGRFERMDATSV